MRCDSDSTSYEKVDLFQIDSMLLWFYNTGKTCGNSIGKEPDMENTGNYYLISHLVRITGLTDRTIRNYISSGILRGEKINGLWHFTPEQVESFICHPAVRPSILAKHNAAVYDFLLDSKKSACETCMILDIPGRNEKEIAEYFCYRINNEGFQKISFSFDSANGVSRIILKGRTEDVLRLVNDFMKDSD